MLGVQTFVIAVYLGFAVCIRKLLKTLSVSDEIWPFWLRNGLLNVACITRSNGGGVHCTTVQLYTVCKLSVVYMCCTGVWERGQQDRWAQLLPQGSRSSCWPLLLNQGRGGNQFNDCFGHRSGLGVKRLTGRWSRVKIFFLIPLLFCTGD